MGEETELIIWKPYSLSSTPPRVEDKKRKHLHSVPLSCFT